LYANLLLNVLYHIEIEMKIRESCLQTGNFIYKPGISLTKQDFHLQRGSLGLQRGFSGYYLPINQIMSHKNIINRKIYHLPRLILFVLCHVGLYILCGSDDILRQTHCTVLGDKHIILNPDTDFPFIYIQSRLVTDDCPRTKPAV